MTGAEASWCCTQPTAWPRLVQYAAVEALRCRRAPADLAMRKREEYKQRGATCWSHGLRDLGLRMRACREGAFYAFPKSPTG